MEHGGEWEWKNACAIRGGVEAELCPKNGSFSFFLSGFSFRFIPTAVSDSNWGIFHFCDLMSSAAEQNFNGGYVLYTTPFRGKKKDNHNLSLPVPIHLS